MYFNYPASITGGHSVIGLPSAGKKAYFAEGSTRRTSGGSGFDQWLSVFNLNNRKVRGLR